MAEAFQRQQRGEVLMLVAEANRFPIGQLWIDLVKKQEESIGIIWALRVMPAFQNLGVGSITTKYIQNSHLNKADTKIKPEKL